MTSRIDVTADAAVPQEAALRVEHGLAVRFNVGHRSVRTQAPVYEAAKWLVRLDGRNMQAPLLGLLLDVDGDVPPPGADPTGGVETHGEA
jgi:hypothetical protein